jgi:putrescine transport system ATP-binding protein
MGEATPSFLQITGVSKRFNTFEALRDVSLSIQKGEIFSLLGGSGCGKTTLLRILAGFETPTTGGVILDGQDLAGIAPWDRPIHMMFQSYALFPHMTVEENVGYGLKHENKSDAERKDRIRAMLELVQLTPFVGRKPHQISGGQRQRVALARALAREPKLLLLDEPLGALDKKLREQTQFELMNIQARTGITFIVVTHDQEEAMTLSDRIAVMDKGEIKQVGTPTEIYEFPKSKFIASFIGSITTFPARVLCPGQDETTVEAEAFGGKITARSIEGLRKGQELTLALRPEKIVITKTKPKIANAFAGEVKDLAYFGKDSLYRIQLASGQLLAVHAVNSQRAGEDKRAASWGEKVWIGFEPPSAILLTE